MVTASLISRLSRTVDLIEQRSQQNRPLKVVRVRCGYQEDRDAACDRHFAVARQWLKLAGGAEDKEHAMSQMGSIASEHGLVLPSGNQSLLAGGAALLETLYVAGNRVLTLLAQAADIRRKRCKRRFQPVRKIGRAAPRSLDLTFLAVKQCVDLVDEWPHLDRCCGWQMPDAPRSDVCNAVTQRMERPQTKADLDRCRHRQHDAEQAECHANVLCKCGSRCGYARKIGGRHHSDPHALIPAAVRLTRLSATSTRAFAGPGISC